MAPFTNYLEQFFNVSAVSGVHPSIHPSILGLVSTYYVPDPGPGLVDSAMSTERVASWSFHLSGGEADK